MNGVVQPKMSAEETAARLDHSERLMEAIGRLKPDAHRRGLIDEIIDEELAAYNAERRDPADHQG